MPLDVSEFDSKAKSTTGNRLGKNQLAIAELLRSDLTKAYTQGEIKKETDIEFDAAVNTALHSLKIKGLAINKRVDGLIYWGGTDGLFTIDSNGEENTERAKTNDEDEDGQDGGP